MHGTRARSKLWRLALISGAAVSLAPTGCERDNPAERAIIESRNTLTAAGAGGSAAPPREALKQSYSKTLATIKAAEQAPTEEQAIASAIGALASGGQGGLASAAYREADGRLLVLLNAAGAKLNLCRQQRALAAALLGYDPAEDIAAFDRQIAERQQELASARRAFEENESRVRSLRERSEARAAEARRMMQSLLDIRQRLSDAAPGEREVLARRLNDARRQAEAVFKESELLAAETDEISPRSPELRLAVERVERQIASLESAKDRAHTLARFRAEASAQASRDADAVARELADALAQARKAFDEDVAPAYQSARAMLANSASLLSRARGGPDPKALAAATGMAAQSLASIDREFAESASRLALLLEEAGSIQPPIPSSAEHTEAASALRERARSASASAIEQYERAKAAFLGVGGPADLRERIGRLTAMIDAMRLRLGAPADEPPLAQPPPTQREDATPPPSAEDAAPAGADEPPLDSDAPATPEHDESPAA